MISILFHAIRVLVLLRYYALQHHEYFIPHAVRVGGEQKITRGW